MTNEGGRRRYQAFISYSHEDRPIARALQNGLQRLGVPWYRPSPFQIFRDDSTLAAGPALWSAIERALRDSDHLILLASPAAARSAWVERELRWWLTNRTFDTVLIGITGGTLETHDAVAGGVSLVGDAVPSPLSTRSFDDVPRWIDLRQLKEDDDLDTAHPIFRERIAEFASPLRKVDKNQLVGDDVRQQARWARLRNGALVLLGALAIVATLASVQFFLQRQEALRQAAVAEAREFAARSANAGDPFVSLVLGVEASQRTETPLVEARAAVAKSLQRIARLGASPIGPPRHVHGDAVTSLRWSTDGSQLETTSRDGRAIDWASATELAEPTPGDPRASTAPSSVTTVSRDGNLTAVSLPDGSIALKSDGRAPAMTLQPPSSERATAVQSIAWRSDGSQLAASYGDTSVLLWDIRSGALLNKRFGDSLTPASQVVWSPDDRLLAVSIAFGRAGITLWSADDPSAPLRSIPSPGPSIGWSPDGTRLAGVGDDGILRFFDPGSGRQVGDEYREETGGARYSNAAVALAWSPDGARLATGHEDGAVRFWSTRPPLGDPKNSSYFPSGALATSEAVRGVTWAPDSRRLAMSMDDGVLIVDVVDDEVQHSIVEIDGVFGKPSWSHDGRLVAVTRNTGELMLIDSVNGGTSALSGNSGAQTLAWSPAGPYLASGSADGSVWLWDAQRGVPLGRPLQAQGRAIAALSFLHGGQEVAAIDAEGSAIVWSVAEGVVLRYDRPQKTSSVDVAAFSPEGDRAVLAGFDQTASINRIDRPGMARALGGLTDVSAVTWTTDGNTVAAAIRGEGDVRLFDAEGNTLITLDGDGLLFGVDFSPDGRQLATSGWYGVRVWTDVPEGTACDLAIRALGKPQLDQTLGPGRGRPRCSDATTLSSRPTLPVKLER